MLPNSLTNFDLKVYYQNKRKFSDVYSTNNLSKIKDGVRIINLDEYEPKGNTWISLYLNDNNVIYLDSFGV